MAIKPRDLEGPFTKPLKKKRFRKESKAALRLAFGKAERGINKEIKGSKMQQRRIGDWFNEYGDQIDSAAERTSGAYSQANQSIQQNSASSANYAEQLRQKMAQEAQQDAARRGVAYDPSGSYTAADANLARLNSADTLSGVTGAQGASQAAMFADKSRIGERESIEQRLREQARRRALQQEKRDMAGDKGALMADMFAGARDSERDFYLGLKASQEPGKDRRHASSEAHKDRRLSRKEAHKDRKFDRKQAGKDRKHDRKHGDTGDSGGDGERQVDHADVRKALGMIRSLDGKKATKFAKLSRKEKIDALLQEDDSFEGKEIKRALKRLRKQSGGKWWDKF